MNKTRVTRQMRSGRLSGVRRILTLRLAFGAACILLLSFAAIWTWRWLSDESPITDGVALLTKAYRQERPTEARISGFRYAAFLARRGGEEIGVSYVIRDRAERLLLDAVSEQPGPAAHHALGKSYLAKGSIAKAIDQFEKALTQDTNNAQLHSDLGVALFELSRFLNGQSKYDRTLELLARSFEHVDHALHLDPQNREALFNRALILAYMKLPAEAKSSWETYLSQESEADWVGEGRRRLRILTDTHTAPATRSEMLDEFLSAVEKQDSERGWQVLTENKEMITGMFIPQELARVYLNEGLPGSPKAVKVLEALRFSGKLERERAHDPFVSEMAEFYAGASASQRATLKQAQANLLAGYSSCLKPNYKEALPAFEQARALFLKSGDEWEARICDYWIAYCTSQLPKLRESTATLLALAEFCESKHYYWLLSQAVCWLANNYTELGQHSDSVQSYNRALAITQSTSDSYLSQKILSQLGNEYNLMGQPVVALEHHWRSLQLVNSRYTSLRQIWRNFLYIARTLIAMKMYGAAKAYGLGMVNLAKTEIKEPGFVHFSNVYAAQIYGSQGDFNTAFQLASESLNIAQSLSDQKLSAGSMRLIAHLQRQAGKLEEALSTYDRAIQNYEQMDLSLYSYDTHKGRLICYAALNDSQRFEAELPYVLEQYEEYRVKIREEQNRNSFFDSEQSVYDLAIGHAVQKGDHLLALDYVEKSRARSLLKSLTNQNQPQASIRPADIQARMPPNVQLVEYAVLKDRIVIWVISQGVFKTFTRDVSSEYLHERISKYVNTITSGPHSSADLDALSQEIYDIVIAPIAQELDAQKVLCIVPDKALSYLPFATLVSPRSGQYLVKEYALLSSPSLGVFLQATDSARRGGPRKSEALLTIGNPEFDPQDYPDLPNLPAAAREAEQIAQLYPGSPSLIGSKAVKSSIEKLLPEANVFHFAGHYIMNERYPLLSRLVLAKTDGTGEKDLMTGDLVGLHLPRTHLVVLSACQTGGEKYYNGEGLIGISRAFLEKGIPLVVASQWPVESESTSQLMIKFHRYRREVSSVEALRKSQLEMLSEANGPYRHPYYWAAFVPLGGYTDF